MKVSYGCCCTSKTADTKIVVKPFGNDGEERCYYYMNGENLFNSMLGWESGCVITLYIKSRGGWWKYKEVKK
jgi:hypothetical protein